MNTPTNTPIPTPPPIHPTPKNRFLSMSDRTISGHRNMVSGEQFDISADFAMAELVRKLVSVEDPNQYYAMAAFLRIQGAHEFLSGMKNLGEKGRAPAPVKPEGNLDHKV